MNLPEIVYSLHRLRSSGNITVAHSHETWELVCYISGFGRVETDARLYKYCGNSIILIPPKVRHTEYNDCESDLVFIDFNPGSVGCTEGMYACDEIMSELAQKTMSEFSLRNPINQSAASLYLQILLLKLSGQLSAGYEVVSGKNPSLESACRYICDYYNTDIKLDELAASVGYSTDRFRHIFKERFGISPKQMILFNRFKTAKQLLAGDEKIENIASLCGFGSASQFNAMFKKIHKMTPGEYRKMIIEQKNK
jgi:AraC family transcriptional activator of pobA